MARLLSPTLHQHRKAGAVEKVDVHQIDRQVSATAVHAPGDFGAQLGPLKGVNSSLDAESDGVSHRTGRNVHDCFRRPISAEPE